MLRSDKFEVYVVEYTQYSTQYIVQRTQLQAILGDRFKTLGYLDSMSQGDRNKKLKSVLKEINPDIVHIDEAPESFDSFNKMPAEIQQWLYSQEWRVIETNHNISFNPNENDSNQISISFAHHIT